MATHEESGNAAAKYNATFPPFTAHMSAGIPKSYATPPMPTARVVQDRAPRRKHDAEQTRQNILDVATEEFSTAGLAGARVDAIAARTRTTKRMIYYYFGSKEELYQAVLDKVYGGIRDIEMSMQLGDQPPEQAMESIVGLTFDYHDAHPNFVRLVAIENFEGARHLQRSTTLRGKSVGIIQLLETILARGVNAGVFRDGVDAIDLHMLMSSFSYHRVANRFTFGTLFGRDPLDPEHRSFHRQMMIDTVMRYVRL